MQTEAECGPDAALAKLVAGNHAFVTEMTGTRKQSVAERAALGAGQAPWASILTCADSRVVPEIIFNTGLGDVFVARVAGNVAEPAEIASLEYGATILGSQLILVMGHSSCGAVQAAIDAANGSSTPSEHLTHLVRIIEPAVRSSKGKPGNELANAIKANVHLAVSHLRTNAILNERIGQGKLKVVGGYYDVATGRMSLLS